MSPTVVIAPDSFKGSLSASKVARAIGEGWASVRSDDEIVVLPQADGGEGTLEAVSTAVAGSRMRSAGTVTGPDGSPHEGLWLELPGRVGVVEMAQPSGLPLMPLPDALGATSRGLGEVITAALDADMRSLVIGLGGSASTDGGLGALRALGLRAFAAHDGAIAEGGGALGGLARIDASGLRKPPSDGVVLLSDVRAPLLGATGAAAVFGPQKGANTADVAALELGLTRLATLLGGEPSAAGNGAAGGTAYGFSTAWGATIVPGAPYLAELTGLPLALASADVLLTGEGRFDATSVTGKLVGHLLELAASAGVLAGVIAGQIDVESGVWATSLTDLAGSSAEAMRTPTRWLHEAGAAAARALV